MSDEKHVNIQKKLNVSLEDSVLKSMDTPNVQNESTIKLDELLSKKNSFLKSLDGVFSQEGKGTQLQVHQLDAPHSIRGPINELTKSLVELTGVQGQNANASKLETSKDLVEPRFGGKRRPKKTKTDKRRKGVRVPIRYVPKYTTRKDKNTLKQELKKSRKLYEKNKYYTRKKVKSFKSKPSHHVKNAKKIYNMKDMKVNKELAKKTGCSLESLKKIVSKGKGAYFSSGSRPNQTAHSWGYARLASSITGGKSSMVDYSVLKSGCNSKSKALKLANKTKRKYKYNYGTRKVKSVKL